MNKKTTHEVTRSRGTIICTASNAGIYPFPMAPLYAATKAGVIGLVRSLARPLGQADIQINALAPSVIGNGLSKIFHFLLDYY
jgi:NAD(P)-dependent dehydrogenase (short-subunit alcohol dehydrogenase family)